jgi:hypothetical protein
VTSNLASTGKDRKEIGGQKGLESFESISDVRSSSRPAQKAFSGPMPLSVAPVRTMPSSVALASPRDSKVAFSGPMP